MPSARLLSQRPQSLFATDGTRISVGQLIVDLGYLDLDLEGWAFLSGHGVRYFEDVDTALVYRNAQTWNTTVVRVPDGFEYDGASLPMLEVVKLVAGEKERYEAASRIHDLLYRYQAPRAAADRAFWAIARSGSVTTSVGPVRGWLVWAALRVGGGLAYRENGRKLRGA